MHMARIQMVVFLSIFLSSVLMAREVKTPYGRKMCQHFCKIADCSHQFMVKDLSCHIVFNKNSSRGRRYEIVWREEEQLLTKEKSPRTISPTSTSTKACIPAAVSVLYAYGKQVYKVPVMPEMEERFVRGFKENIKAMVYSRTFKYIIAGIMRPSLILTFKENDFNNEPDILISMYFLICMTIDNNIDTVFIGGQGGIEKYTLKDGIKTRLFDKKCVIICLTLITKKQIIYFANNRGVSSLQYNGKSQKVISRKYSINVVFIESVNDIYCLARRTVSSLVSHRPLNGVPPATVSSFVSHQNLIVYATPENITILNTTSNKSTQVKTRYLGTSPIIAVMKPIDIG